MSRKLKNDKDYVNKNTFINNCELITESGCWIWLNHIGKDGYGVLRYDYKMYKAHRWAYMLYSGEIPTDKFVLHKCDVKSCVNPAHLFIGTCKENSLDMCIKNRQAKGSKIWNSKLTENDVIQIKRKLKEKITMQKLADEYGVKVLNIARIKAGKIWGHLL